MQRYAISLPAPYVALWTLGLVIGVSAGMALLRHRRLLDISTAGCLICAFVGFTVGVKWHYRLEVLPWRSALVILPRDFGDPGGRTPLGVAVGAACAAGWCWWRRLPWRDVGDALALAAMLGLSLGRIGCIVSGCCLGKVCPAWAASVCVLPRPGSQAFMAQVAFGQRSEPLPVIPLSTLFSVVGLCIVALLLWQLRRGAPPGAPTRHGEHPRPTCQGRARATPF